MKIATILKRIHQQLALGLITILTATSSMAENVGLPSKIWNTDIYAEQRNSQWCWAASIQMVLKLQDIDVDQSSIVRRSYGVSPDGALPNWPGSFQVITRNLNGWSVTDSGTDYLVSCAFHPEGLHDGRWLPSSPMKALMAPLAIESFDERKGIILGYSPKNGGSGHAVVLSGIEYFNDPNRNNLPVLTSITVRDPWPSAENKRNNGKVRFKIVGQNLIRNTAGEDFRINGVWSLVSAGKVK